MRRYMVLGSGIGLVLILALWGCKKEKPSEVAQQKTQQWNLLYEYSFEDSSGNFLFSELGWSSCDPKPTTIDPDGYGCVTVAQDGAPGYGKLSAEVIPVGGPGNVYTCLYNYYTPNDKMSSYFLCPSDQDTGRFVYQIKAWIKLLNNSTMYITLIHSSYDDESPKKSKKFTFSGQPVGIWNEYTIEDTLDVMYNDGIGFFFYPLSPVRFRIDGVRIYKKKI